MVKLVDSWIPISIVERRRVKVEIENDGIVDGGVGDFFYDDGEVAIAIASTLGGDIVQRGSS